MSTVILEWTFTPGNYFEEPIEIHRDDYVLTIADGKAEARMDASAYDRDTSIRQVLSNSLNDRFLGVQLLTHTPYTLSKSTIVRIDGAGRQTVIQEIEGRAAICLGGTADIQLCDKDGNILYDSRRDRINQKRRLAELVEKHRSKDVLLDAILGSYQAAVNDPDNELVHLYEIRDALKEKFGGRAKTCNAIGIDLDSEWERFDHIANNEPLRQGRHRGSNAGALRDATQAELEEARGIARKMIEGYIGQL